MCPQDVLEGKLDVSKTVKRKKDGDGESKLAGKGEDEKPKKKKKDDWPPGPLYDIATMRKPLPCSGTPFKVVVSEN